MKKLGIVFAVVVGILVLAGLAVWLLLDVNRYRVPIQTQLEQRLGRKVMLGQMSLRIVPLQFQVADPVIAEDPRFGTQANFLRAEKLAVQVSLLSLIRGTINVNSVELRRPSVELVKNKEGAWNFTTHGATAQGTASGSSEAPGRGVSLDRLTIVDGQIGVTDLQQSRTRTVYDHIDVTLLDYAPGRPFSFDVAAHIQGEGKQELRIKGNGGPIPEGKPSDMPFRATLSLNQIGLDGLKKFLSTDLMSKSSGFLSGDGQLASQSGTMTAAGKLKLDQARVNNLEIGYPITLDYDVAEKIEAGVVTINNATLHLG